MRRQGDRGYGIIVVMHWFFGQQPGLRPEPHRGAQCARTTRLDIQYVRAMARSEIGAVEGVRGSRPPIDVGRSHGA